MLNRLEVANSRHKECLLRITITRSRLLGIAIGTDIPLQVRDALAEMVDASLHSCHASFEVEHAFIETLHADIQMVDAILRGNIKNDNKGCEDYLH